MNNWWNETVFYEIYMPSFCDGNGDGMGDFKGITSKLDYLKDLGIGGIWLTPFYPSPKVDNGYDIADYYGIDPDYGTLEDFEVFIEEAHRRGIKIIADLVLNHTSSEHPWFQESKSAKDSPKRNWYIWEDQIPNNWESFFGGSAWEFDPTTQQFYYHAFAKEQVDLNWANPEVKKAMFAIMKFWLDKGIDGFRLDVINFLTVQKNWTNNPFDSQKNEQIHLYDKDQEGVIPIIKEIADFVHSYGDKFLVGEVGSEDLNVLKAYSGTELLDVVFNFNLGSLEKWDPNRMYQEIQKMNQVYDQSQMPTLFFSSHDMSRYISRFASGGVEEVRARLVATLMLTAKGVPFIYYGDEIGMRDLQTEHISLMKDIQGMIEYDLKLAEGLSETEALELANKKSRDKSRSPMQWNQGEFAGFSKVQPWISLSKESQIINVEQQQQDWQSLYHYYKQLITLRNQEDSLKYGNYSLLELKDEVMSYVREYQDEKVYISLNLGHQERKIDVPDSFNQMLLSSIQSREIMDKQYTLLPHEAVIMKGAPLK